MEQRIKPLWFDTLLHGHPNGPQQCKGTLAFLSDSIDPVLHRRTPTMLPKLLAMYHPSWRRLTFFKGNEKAHETGLWVQSACAPGGIFCMYMLW